ncbi:hypothetical protein D3C81_1466040 [compost metagenome]
MAVIFDSLRSKPLIASLPEPLGSKLCGRNEPWSLSDSYRYSPPRVSTCSVLPRANGKLTSLFKRVLRNRDIAAPLSLIAPSGPPAKPSLRRQLRTYS